MISSLLWLTSARQASNTQVVGEMGSTPAHTSSWWGFSERERGKDCCYNENELNEHFASFFSLFSSFLLFSYLFFSSFFFPLFSSPFQSQRFITTPGWTHKLLPWFSTYQELIFKKRSEKKERKCKKEDLGQTFSHNVPHCTYLGCARILTENQTIKSWNFQSFSGQYLSRVSVIVLSVHLSYTRTFLVNTILSAFYFVHSNLFLIQEGVTSFKFVEISFLKQSC